MRTVIVCICSMSLSPLRDRDLDLDCDLVRDLPLVLDDLVVLAITNITPPLLLRFHKDSV